MDFLFVLWNVLVFILGYLGKRILMLLRLIDLDNFSRRRIFWALRDISFRIRIV